MLTLIERQNKQKEKRQQSTKRKKAVTIKTNLIHRLCTYSSKPP